jgi:PAS domain S-box-containing protein
MTEITGQIADHALAEQMFRLAVEACPSGMVMIDHDGKMMMVNTEIENQFGYSRQELLGQPVDMLVPERMRAQHARHRHEFTPNPETRRMGAGRDLFGRRKDGTEFPVEVGLNPIRAGDRLLILGVIVDISQRKQMERLKEEFVSTVSHELRTPLTSISGSLGLLVGQWSGKLPESAAKLLTIAHNNSQRLVRLINDILDIEKIESGRVVFNFIRVDLRHVAEQAIEDNRGYSEGYGVKVRLDPASVEADVNADPDRLAQVITNLLSNAIKFSPAGEEVLVSVTRNGNRYRVSVRDHGSGIPEEFKSRIFEKFAQADGTNSRQKGGTGLGLAIVRQIVERLGGRVGFGDAPDGGAEFHVELPAWDGSAGGEIDVNADPSHPRILLCEDDADTASTLRLQLQQAGFAVDLALTVGTAAARADETRYCAVLVDLVLRGGDGIDLISRLRAKTHYRSTPIIVIAGIPNGRRRDVRSSKLNILGWLSKPIDVRRLLSLLQDALANRLARPRILHVDDDADVYSLIKHELHMAEVIHAPSMEDARRAITKERFDLAILDIALGEDSGPDILPDLRDAEGNPIPVIIFSAHAKGIHYDKQVHVALSKMNSSVESLGAVVRDRLARLPARAVKEFA